VRFHYVYEPMRQIGGDLLFVFPPSHERPTGGVSALSVVVLDVTGHGIAAALTVNRIVGELERQFIDRADVPPGDVLKALNRYVYNTLAKHDHYVTAICLRVDSTREMLDYASGGHPTAFLRRANGTIQMLESTAPLLGILAPEEFDSDPQSIPFTRGDAVVAYTDGAAEARNNNGQMLGTAGVKKLLSKIAGDGRIPPDWPGDVMRQVVEYRGAPPDDDTLIATLFRPR
jgi:serine phosphatase RsbU (regulator of sigma subunit)